MRPGRAGVTAALALALLAESACRRSAKVPVQPSAPAVTAPPLEMPPTPKPQPRPMEEPPLPPPPMPAPPEQEPTVITPSVIKLPPPPKPARKRGSAKAQAAKPKPVETTAPAEPAAQPAQPAAAAPILQEVIPGDETQRLRQSLAAYQATARHALAALKGRPLTREQSETSGRIRAFLRQAAETESRDIAAAAELARRAALLAEDLRKSID